MRADTSRGLVVAVVIVVGLLVLVGGGAIIGGGPGGGMMGGGRTGTAWMGGFGWMWVPAVLIVGLAALLAWGMFGKKP